MDLAARGVPHGRKRIGTAMRLAEEKNPVGLVEAYAAARPGPGRWALVVAGDGPLRTAMQARAQAHGVADELHLLGACSDLERFYAALDLFVLPSFAEGLPLALLEAMACERPVVATAVGQVPQVLAGLDAAVLTPGDVPALAQALRAGVDQPPPTAPLRRRVVERFSVQRMAADYAAVYDTLAR
jgi:glycosyltransferase involved in cell wall biosynthesis